LNFDALVTGHRRLDNANKSLQFTYLVFVGSAAAEPGDKAQQLPVADLRWIKWA
jgi:hypothetical protein